MNINKIFIWLLLCIGAALWSSEIEELRLRYDEEGLLFLWDQSKNKDLDQRSDIAYGLFWILSEKDSSRKELHIAAHRAIELIQEEATAREYFRLAKLYESLITDAGSWMKYNSKKNEYYQLCIAMEPNY